MNHNNIDLDYDEPNQKASIDNTGTIPLYDQI